MGDDFYPRLTASIHHRADANRLVNEQTLIGLLLAGPGVLATLTFAPLVITLFYSATFATAVTILRWITLGVMLQVITWPMGFIIVAEGKSTLFFFAELAWAIVAVCLAWACVGFFGLDGAGIAFFGSYVFHCVLIYPIARRLSGFHWSRANCLSAFFFLSLIAVVFCGFYVLPKLPAFVVGTIAIAVSVSYSLRSIVKLIPPERLPRQLRHLLAGLRMGSAVSTVS
jgi:PST family polysaccharide transporter